MLRGVTVSVAVRSATGEDGHGAATYGTAETEVGNVIVQPGSCADLDASRPEGARVSLTLHWPKDAAVTALKGAVVTLAGEHAGAYRVVGDPVPYQSDLTPGDWNMPVEVERCDG